MKVKFFHNEIAYCVIFSSWELANSWTTSVPATPSTSHDFFRTVDHSQNLMKLQALRSNGPMVVATNDEDKLNQFVLDYISCVEMSIDFNQLKAFTIRGPAKTDFDSQSEARGYLRMITGRPIVLSKDNAVYIQVTFKYNGATDICKNWSILDCQTNLKSMLLTSVSVPQDVILPASEWGPCPPTTFGLPRGMQSATLEMTNGTKCELKVSRGNASLKFSQGSNVAKGVKQQQLLQTHDRNTYTFVDLSSPVWLSLGVISPSTGTVKPGMSSKLRQCQKFVEIVDRLVRECIDDNHVNRRTSDISVVDMGCGRGYLTFALHSYLHNHYQTQVSSRGIDMRPKLVKEISVIASASGAEFTRLRFEVGTIESFLAEPQLEQKDNFPVEVVIALHACDTASDDAIWSGIYRNSAIIVVAPCCHRQLRPQLNQHVSGDQRADHPYMDILRHNIYRERFAETITDSMRALLLEISGYKVQVFEFVGGEHTSKNVMITAVKDTKSRTLRDSNTDAFYRNKLERLQSLAKLHGIKQQKLASWIGVELSVHDHLSVNDNARFPSHPSKMPKLKI